MIVQRVVWRLLVRIREATGWVVGSNIARVAGISCFELCGLHCPVQVAIVVTDAVGVEGLDKRNPEVLRLPRLIVGCVVARHKMRCRVRVATETVVAGVGNARQSLGAHLRGL